MKWGEPTRCPVEEWTPVGRLGQATCGVVSLAVAVVSLGVGYSVVVAVVSVFPLLSTTAIVFIWAFVWLVTWLALLLGVTAVRSRAPGDSGTTASR
jgi:hypothetical protein